MRSIVVEAAFNLIGLLKFNRKERRLGTAKNFLPRRSRFDLSCHLLLLLLFVLFSFVSTLTAFEFSSCLQHPLSNDCLFRSFFFFFSVNRALKMTFMQRKKRSDEIMKR